MTPKLTLALQKKGRLSEDSLQMLKSAGLNVEITDRSLKVYAKNFPLEILLLRAGDIPEIVFEEVADIGIVGQNTVVEKDFPLQEIQALDFGKCTLSLAFPENASDQHLIGKRVATSYPNILRAYLKEKDIYAQIVDFSGSVELAPKLNIADCICDLVSTGSTLKSNGLIQTKTIFKSQAVIVAHQNFTTEKQVVLDKLLLRLRAVITAKKYKYIVMNADRKNLSQIEACIPGLKRPTISSLAESEFVSIASVVEEDFFWSTIEKIKAAGAFDILILPIEKMIL